MLLYVAGKYRTLKITLLGNTALFLLLSSLSAQAQNFQKTTYQVSAKPQMVLVQNQPTASTNSASAQLINQSSLKSYKEWKTNMIQESESRLKSSKENLAKYRQISNDPNASISKSQSSDRTQSEAGLQTQIQSLQEQINRDQLQLSLAQELTITDYFVGYLAKQKSMSQAIKEVSGKLTAEEVAELMTAYANNFFQSRPQSVNPAPRADSESY